MSLGLARLNAQSTLLEHTLKPDCLAKKQVVGISDFEWLAGYWTCTGMGGQCVENWIKHTDNSMQGIFRLEKEGKIVFTEYMSILQDSVGMC